MGAVTGAAGGGVTTTVRSSRGEWCTAPAAAVRFVARQLDVDRVALDGYGLLTGPARPSEPGEVVFCLPVGHARRSRGSANGWQPRHWCTRADRAVPTICARLYELRLVRPGLTMIGRSLVGAALRGGPAGNSPACGALLTTERYGSPQEAFVAASASTPEASATTEPASPWPGGRRPGPPGSRRAAGRGWGG